MLDSKTDHIQKIDCLSSLACCPCFNLDILNRCTKEQSLKKRKIGYLRYHASTEENSAGFLATHFCQWLPAEARRRPPAPGHCTGFICSKHATLALKPLGSGLLGCDCSGQSSYSLIVLYLFKKHHGQHWTCH